MGCHTLRSGPTKPARAAGQALLHDGDPGGWGAGWGAGARDAAAGGCPAGPPSPSAGLTLCACVRRGGWRGLRAGRRALQQRPVLPAQLQVQLHVRGRRGGLHAAVPPRAAPAPLVPPAPAGELARALLRAVGVRRRRQEAPQDGAAPHGHLRWVRARARGAGRAAPARGGGDGELSRSPAGLLEQSHRVGPGAAAAACPPHQCVWPSDRRLTEHCRVGDLKTKAFYPPRQILPHRRLPPIPPPLFSPSVLKGLCCLLSPSILFSHSFIPAFLDPSPQRTCCLSVQAPLSGFWACVLPRRTGFLIKIHKSFSCVSCSIPL